ncbi:MAG: hypothetical protein ACQ9MH_11115 [Nitrospinales bacterium]
MAKLGILVLHGMGDQDEDFADSMKHEIDDILLDDHRVTLGDVSWQPVHWAKILKKKEQDLWKDVNYKKDLDFSSLRKFVINALGDAAAYQRVPWQKPSIYDKIHKVVYENVKKLRTSLGNNNVPLIIMAHSLGGSIISDYIWDRQKYWSSPEIDPFGKNDFEEMKTLSGIITFGCNIPLFSLAYDPIKAIKFPYHPSKLARYFPKVNQDAKIKRVVKWKNYYDEDDILGFPIKKISPSYNKAVAADFNINVGNILTSWNPMSHSEYWTDDSFTEPAAQQIAKVVKLL